MKSIFTTDPVQDIAEFHEHFKLPQREHGKRPDPQMILFRLKFLAEELHELNVAAAHDDLEGMLDALVDLAYVAMGTAWLLNLDFNAAWMTVHKANMQKQRAEKPSDSKRGTTFDVVKPKGWQAPDFKNWIPKEDLALKVDPVKAKNKKQLDILDYLKELNS